LKALAGNAAPRKVKGDEGELPVGSFAEVRKPDAWLMSSVQICNNCR